MWAPHASPATRKRGKNIHTSCSEAHSSFPLLFPLFFPSQHSSISQPGAQCTTPPTSMESRAKESQEFMNVDSFSQLPFLRPAAQVRQKAIRLFGIDCTSSSSSSDDREPPAAASAASESNVSLQGAKDALSSEDSGRRFECHYCYRNFPTSQALGGHQNAHKRERQHAKRAHLHSALAHNGGYSSRHVYGLIDYHFDSAPHDRSWSDGGVKVSGGHVLSAQPINGNPLPGLWRIPTVGRNGHAVILDLGRSPVAPMQRVESRAPDRLVYGGGGGGFVAHEHVSLDLRL